MKRSRYPTAAYPKRVGKYPAVVGAGDGLVWDEVLEYRVWCHPEKGAPGLDGRNDYYIAFSSYPKALAFSRKVPGAEAPLALIRQRQHIDEPKPGHYVHVRTPRLAEWPVEFLSRPRRTRQTIPDFLAPDAPANRLELLRGTSPSEPTTRRQKRR